MEGSKALTCVRRFFFVAFVTSNFEAQSNHSSSTIDTFSCGSQHTLTLTHLHRHQADPRVEWRKRANNRIHEERRTTATESPRKPRPPRRGRGANETVPISVAAFRALGGRFVVRPLVCGSDAERGLLDRREYENTIMPNEIRLISVG